MASDSLSSQVAYFTKLVKKHRLIKRVRKLNGQVPCYPANTWVMPRKGGAIIGERYFTEHALARMAPKNPEVMAILDQRLVEKATKDGIPLGTKQFKTWLSEGEGSSFTVDPRGIPPSVVEAEILVPNSTRIEVTVSELGDVITVITK